MRLQKALADAGIASRRHAEEMIRAGRVQVNGLVARAMGTSVDPTHDRISVDGRVIVRPRQHTYILLYKPRGVVTTASDPQGRQTVLDCIETSERLFPVGRLDADSEGLILLTNDGALANRLMHPRYEHEKEYRVLVSSAPTREALDQLRRGVQLADGRAAAASVHVDERGAKGTWLRIVLREGRKRQIRRMLEVVGYEAQRLIRVRLGPLKLGTLRVGQWRPLTPSEIMQLQRIRERPA